MRILHTEASQGWGGQEIRIINESKIFVENGHSIAIAANPNSPLIQNAKKANLEVIEINLSKKNIKNLISLRTAIKNFSPDVISCHSSTDHWLSALARIFLKNPPKIVRTRHISAQVTRNLPTKWLYRNATSHIITTGIAIKKQLTSDNFLPIEMITSIPTGIDSNKYYPGNINNARASLKLPLNKIIIGTVATLRSWKGHSYLIEAFSKINNSELLLIIVGDGPQMSNLTKQINQLNLQNKVILTGNKTDVLPYLQAFDIFAFPSYANEGVPQSILQAMATGLPILTCCIGGIPEAIQNYHQAKCCLPNNSVDLAINLEKIISQGIEKYRAHIPFSLDYLYKESLQVYETSSNKASKLV
jgi:glycosyltransferase involved in cell wall biosynthesis